MMDGRVFVVVTVNVRVVDAPSASVAVTVIVDVPVAAPGVKVKEAAVALFTVTDETVATAVLLDDAVTVHWAWVVESSDSTRLTDCAAELRTTLWFDRAAMVGEAFERTVPL